MSATLARVQKSFKWQPKNQVGTCVNWRAKKERAFFLLAYIVWLRPADYYTTHLQLQSGVEWLGSSKIYTRRWRQCPKRSCRVENALPSNDQLAESTVSSPHCAQGENCRRGTVWRKKIMGTKGQTWWSQIKQRSTEKTCRKQLCFPRTCNVFRQRSAVQQLALRSNIKEETRTPLKMIIATRLLHSSRSLFKLLIDSSCGRLCTRCTFPFRLLASFLKSYVRYRWASLSQSAPSIPPGIGCFFWRFRRIPHGRYFRCKNQHISVDYINLVDASEGENRQRLATVTFDSPGEFFIKFSAFGDATECPSD